MNYEEVKTEPDKLDARTKTEKAENSAGVQNSEGTNLTRMKDFFKQKKVIIGLVVAIGIILLVLILSICLSSGSNDLDKKGSEPIDVDDDKILNRTVWGAVPSRNISDLKTPVPLVLLTQAGGKSCQSLDDCSDLVKKLQDTAMNKGDPDIYFNFLIRDQFIFTGRGWDKTAYDQKDTILIAILGNRGLDKVSDETLNSTEYLLGVGVKRLKLSKDYKVTCHQDCGENLKEKIKDLEHYDPGYKGSRLTKRWSLCLFNFGSCDTNINYCERNKTHSLQTHEIICRDRWHGRDASEPIAKQTTPVSQIVIRQAGGKSCYSFDDCADIVGRIQNISFNKNQAPDIEYNFLIGGDGNIYVGRGWDLIPQEKTDMMNVVFIGNFKISSLSDTMIDAARLLLADGVAKNKLVEEYKLIVCTDCGLRIKNETFHDMKRKN